MEGIGGRGVRCSTTTVCEISSLRADTRTVSALVCGGEFDGPFTKPAFIDLPSHGSRTVGAALEKPDTGAFFAVATPAGLREFHQAGCPEGGFVARFELPLPGIGFTAERASSVVSTVLSTDYGGQRLIADHFYRLLEQDVPYRVEVHTAGDARLEVIDQRPWFDLSGPLDQGDRRILPGGEVAYTGSSVGGVFAVTGGLLAIPQDHRLVGEAAPFYELQPADFDGSVRLQIEAGILADVEGMDTRLGGLVRRFVGTELTEVGIGFNHLVTDLSFDWANGANESYPGVHLGFGGDPDPAGPQDQLGVHVDLISSVDSVVINGTDFTPTLLAKVATG